MKLKKYFLQDELLETMEQVSNGGISLLDTSQKKLFRKIIKAIKRNQEIIILIDDKDDTDYEIYTSEF